MQGCSGGFSSIPPHISAVQLNSWHVIVFMFHFLARVLTRHTRLQQELLMPRSELTFNYGLIVHSVERQPFTDLISNALKDRGGICDARRRRGGFIPDWKGRWPDCLLAPVWPAGPMTFGKKICGARSRALPFVSAEVGPIASPPPKRAGTCWIKVQGSSPISVIDRLAVVLN